MALILSAPEPHDLIPVMCGAGVDQVKTFVKMPVTPGCTIFAHLLERQEVRDWYDCNPCLKSELEITVGFCVPAEEPPYAARVLQSGFRPFFAFFWRPEKKLREPAPTAGSPM